MDFDQARISFPVRRWIAPAIRCVVLVYVPIFELAGSIR
jgi:hypothetical protein